MRESLKAILSLVIIVVIFVAALAWFGQSSPWLRYGVPAVGVLALVVLLKIHLARDLVPDFLREVNPNYFERDGFCFCIQPVAEKGACWMVVFFQNKYERPCRVHLAVKPSFGFWLNKRRIASLDLEIECGPAAYGLTRVPWAIPREYQGKTQVLNVGATVKYPEGRGRILRYKDGIRVGGHKFHNPGWVHLVVTLVTFGLVGLSRPASLKVLLPADVSETVDDEATITSQQLWPNSESAPAGP